MKALLAGVTGATGFLLLRLQSRTPFAVFSVTVGALLMAYVTRSMSRKTTKVKKEWFIVEWLT